MKQKLFQDLGELIVFIAVIIVALLPFMTIITVNIIEGF